MQICPKCRTRFENQVERCTHDGRRLVADLTGVTVAGRYLLRELLGVGGMDSSVWLAMQQPVQRPVAVKLLPPTDGESADRFARGARIASNLAHPHITVVHDYGRTDEGQLFLVMELLEGRILHDVMKTGALPVEQALHITDQVLKALDHAHKKNVVHRDIKPGNLFLCTRNEDPDFVKVLDFGIARYIDANDAFFDDPHQEITTTRQICGTPQYMAPEQIAMGVVDARTDLYALGIVLYRMITGELPFQSKDHRELFRAHLTQAPPTFCQCSSGVAAARARGAGDARPGQEPR
jgi:serine/threonine protein kinase